MIRTFEKKDLNAIMQIWLDTNLKAHHFISTKYWTDNCEALRIALPQAEVYVYENDATRQIEGFIGLSNEYIKGIFVRDGAQSKGIGNSYWIMP